MIPTTPMDLTLPMTLTLTNLKPTLSTCVLVIFFILLDFLLNFTLLFLFENKIIRTCIRFVDLYNYQSHFEGITFINEQ